MHTYRNTVCYYLDSGWTARTHIHPSGHPVVAQHHASRAAPSTSTIIRVACLISTLPLAIHQTPTCRGATATCQDTPDPSLPPDAHFFTPSPCPSPLPRTCRMVKARVHTLIPINRVLAANTQRHANRAAACPWSRQNTCWPPVLIRPWRSTPDLPEPLRAAGRQPEHARPAGSVTTNTNTIFV